MNQFLLLFIMTLSLFSHAQELPFTESIIQDAVEATQEMQNSMNEIINVMPFEENITIQTKQQPQIEAEILPLTETIPLINEIEATNMVSETIMDTTPLVTEVMNNNMLIGSTPIQIEYIDNNLSTEENKSISTLETMVEENNSSDNNPDNNDTSNPDEGSSSMGGEIFKQSLKKYCHFTGEIFAKKYTQEEWEEIGAHGEFEETLYEICPKVKGHYKEEWTQDLYQFSYEYASDSDNIPEC